jgi:hypothetical protein
VGHGGAGSRTSDRAWQVALAESLRGSGTRAASMYINVGAAEDDKIEF